MDLAVLPGRGLTMYVARTLGSMWSHPAGTQGFLPALPKREELRSLINSFSVSFLTARFEDFEPQDTRVQYFWEALNNFTNGEQFALSLHILCHDSSCLLAGRQTAQGKQAARLKGLLASAGDTWKQLYCISHPSRVC